MLFGLLLYDSGQNLWFPVLHNIESKKVAQEFLQHYCRPPVKGVIFDHSLEHPGFEDASNCAACLAAVNERFSILQERRDARAETAEAQAQAGDTPLEAEASDLQGV